MPMIDQEAAGGWDNTSTVVTDKTKANCPAPQQGNECKSCRACWDKSIKNIAYLAHWCLNTRNITRSLKRFESNSKRNKRTRPQATSLQAIKRKPTSVPATSQRAQAQTFPHKRNNFWSRVQAYLPLIQGTGHKDKCILWMFHMEGYLVGWKAYFVGGCILQFYCKKGPTRSISQ